MSRWRPPGKPASKYITPAGYRAMNDELQFLWKVKRPEVTRSVQEAAAQGDRSENAEYIYGKKMLRETDRRIRYLERRLSEVTVVDHVPADQSRIFFGAEVELETETGEARTVRIVGPDEIDTERGWISIDAPLARALIKKTIDDEVVVRTPAGETLYYVVAVHYQQPGRTHAE